MMVLCNGQTELLLLQVGLVAIGCLHKFIVSMTEAFVAKNKVGTNPHISSGDTAFAMEEE